MNRLPALSKRFSPASFSSVILKVGVLIFLIHAETSAAQKGDAEATLKSATETAKQIQKQTGSKPSAKTAPAGDPCTILPLADVRKVFPGAQNGERSRRLEEYGITECSWKGTDGTVVLIVHESNSPGTAKDDVQTLVMGITDPLKPQSQTKVRYESVPGIGSEAVAFVEKEDKSRGILSDGAMLAIRNGAHAVGIMSADLPRRDRTAALKALEDLGRVAAKRLKQ